MDFASIASALSSAGQAAQGIGSIASLFGGGDGASAMDLARTQLHTSLIGMKHAPYATVVGLRRAGLNPMLAIGKATPQASIGMPSPVDDRQVATARGLAAASIANQAAQAELYSAQAANVRADTLNKPVQGTLAGAQAKASESMAALNRQLEVTEGWQSKIKITEHWMRKLQYQLADVNLPKFQREELKLLTAEASAAKTKADLDAVLSKAERLISMGAEGVGAITGGIGNVVRSLSSAKAAKNLGRETFEETATEHGEGWSQSYKRRGYKK